MNPLLEKKLTMEMLLPMFVFVLIASALSWAFTEKEYGFNYLDCSIATLSIGEPSSDKYCWGGYQTYTQTNWQCFMRRNDSPCEREPRKYGEGELVVNEPIKL